MTPQSDTEILDILNAADRRENTLHELVARVHEHHQTITSVSKDLRQIQIDAAEIDYTAFCDLLEEADRMVMVGFAAVSEAPATADPAQVLEGVAARVRYSQTFNHGAPNAIPPPIRYAPYLRDDRMRAVLERLFAESAKLHSIPAGENPALECQIVIRNGPTMVGSLSMTREGLLRFLAAATNGQGIAMLESFFDIGDLVSVIVQRTAPAAPEPESRIFQG